MLDDGRSAAARYANNSNYRNDSLIRKESALLWLLFKPSTQNLTYSGSDGQRSDCGGDQADHPTERDYQVRAPQHVRGVVAEAGLTAGLGAHREKDDEWPKMNKDGGQELEIRINGENNLFKVRSLQARSRGGWARMS